MPSKERATDFPAHNPPVRGPMLQSSYHQDRWLLVPLLLMSLAIALSLLHQFLGKAYKSSIEANALHVAIDCKYPAQALDWNMFVDLRRDTITLHTVHCHMPYCRP
jgi:hypothetical protein